MGGFEAVKGFHREFDEYFNVNRNDSEELKSDKSKYYHADNYTPICVGQYTALRSKEDKYIVDKLEHIPAKAGRYV